MDEKDAGVRALNISAFRGVPAGISRHESEMASESVAAEPWIPRVCNVALAGYTKLVCRSAK